MEGATEMMTKKQIKETYMRKWYGGKWGDIITAIAFYDKYAILMSGEYNPRESGYVVEAVIDRETGENVIEGQCRPCEDKADAIDVAFEMMA